MTNTGLFQVELPDWARAGLREVLAREGWVLIPAPPGASDTMLYIAVPADFVPPRAVPAS